MANIKSAKKRIKVIDKKTAKNRRIKANIKAILKSFDAALEAEDYEAAEQQLRLAEKRIQQAATKSVMHKKTAARKISRLTKRFNEAKEA